MKLELIVKAEGVCIPMHYNHMIQAALLGALKDKAYKEFMHDEGYRYEKRSYKLFTFSKIIGSNIKVAEQKKIKFMGEVKLIVSSSQRKFIMQLKEGVEEKGLRLGKWNCDVVSARVLEEWLVGSYLKVETLSPVVAYSTILENEKKRTKYYGPLDQEFGLILRENVIKKYKAITGKEELEDENFDVVAIAGEEYKKSIVYYKDFVIVGFSGKFMLVGNPSLIQLVLEAGLGGKNAQGFGCIREI